MSDELIEAKAEAARYKKERDDLHNENIELKLSMLRTDVDDHEKRIRPLEAGQVKSNTIYALFAGNGILTIVALLKVFNP